jgi:hypothetical protein
MPTPKIWETADDLVVALKKDWNTRASKLRNADADWETSIESAVSGNTFRAFRNLPHRPSRVFREWAFDALITRGYLNELKKVRTQENYDQWLDKLVSDFGKYWKRKMKVSIPFGPSYKLPNLLMKVVCQRLSPTHRKRTVCFLHVPLDSYTLLGIRSCVILPNGRSIPNRATMRFVDSKEVYTAVQHYIKGLARRAGVPMIAYDYLAWDVGH